MVFCAESELIELCNSSEHNESEEDTEKEKNHKLRIDINDLDTRDALLASVSSSFEHFSTLHHPEITTPPPEFSIS